VFVRDEARLCDSSSQSAVRFAPNEVTIIRHLGYAIATYEGTVHMEIPIWGSRGRYRARSQRATRGSAYASHLSGAVSRA
jgi:hypothetical protein